MAPAAAVLTSNKQKTPRSAMWYSNIFLKRVEGKFTWVLGNLKKSEIYGP